MSDTVLTIVVGALFAVVAGLCAATLVLWIYIAVHFAQAIGRHDIPMTLTLGGLLVAFGIVSAWGARRES